MLNISISYELLSEKHTDIISSFKCAERYPEKALEDYLKNDALSDLREGNGVTYLAINKSDNDIVAFYTLQTSSLPFYYTDDEDDDDESDDVLCEISAVRINYFAVNSKYQDLRVLSNNNTPLSATILMKVISEIYSMSITQIGLKAIYLRPLKSAIGFYEKNGFTLDDDVFSPLATADDDLGLMYMFIHQVVVNNKKYG